MLTQTLQFTADLIQAGVIQSGKMHNHPDFHVHLYGCDGRPLTSRFDDVAQLLVELPRLHFEPDGSLLWSGDAWQVGGILYDRNGVLQYAELQGQCPLDRWRALSRRITGAADRGAVVRLSDQSLHDLQTFEQLTWSSG